MSKQSPVLERRIPHWLSGATILLCNRTHDESDCLEDAGRRVGEEGKETPSQVCNLQRILEKTISNSKF